MKLIRNIRDRQILRIALPSIVSNITVPLLGLVDLAIVGHLGSAAYIGAIAIGGMIFNVIYWIFGFLRMGTSGMTSQALGRRNLREIMQILIRSLVVGGLIALSFLVFQVPLRSVA
ncbi:MAG: MATE family efflux transporter, partial [Prevotella pleuritidis]|nr:MATE family efflux transporter [Hoylesella pleuritidis]